MPDDLETPAFEAKKLDRSISLSIMPMVGNSGIEDDTTRQDPSKEKFPGRKKYEDNSQSIMEMRQKTNKKETEYHQEMKKKYIEVKKISQILSAVTLEVPSLNSTNDNHEKYEDINLLLQKNKGRMLDKSLAIQTEKIETNMNLMNTIREEQVTQYDDKNSIENRIKRKLEKERNIRRFTNFSNLVDKRTYVKKWEPEVITMKKLVKAN